MRLTIGLNELREQLVELLRRAGRGDRIVVGPDDDEPVVSGPATSEQRPPAPVLRHRYRSDRTTAEVMAEDRGA